MFEEFLAHPNPQQNELPSYHAYWLVGHYPAGKSTGLVGPVWDWGDEILRRFTASSKPGKATQKKEPAHSRDTG